MVWANGIGVINNWWPKKDRGFASGVATAFSGAAQVVTYLTIMFCVELNPELEWRAAFRYNMIPVLIMLAIFAFYFNNKPEDVGLKPFTEDDLESDVKDKELAAEIEKRGFFYPYKLLFNEP